MLDHVIGITGTSGSGKTTLILAMLDWFRVQGMRVNVVKHSHHPLELEPAGKDSARFRAAGTGEVMVASPYRYAILRDLDGAPEPSLREQIARLAPAELTLVEGFRNEDIPRIEVFRPALARAPYFVGDPSIVAVATDAPVDTALPCLPLNEPERIARFVLGLAWGGLERHGQGRMDLPATFAAGLVC